MMADENKPQEEELKLREDADGSVIVGDEPPPKKDDNEDDESTANAETAEDEEHRDESEVEGETDAEAEARRERNRQRRRENKQHKKEYVESLKRELAARDRIINELNSRVSVVERKSTGSEMAQLERAEQEAIQAYNQFKEIHGRAVEQAQGAMASDAAEKMMLARQRVEQIRGIKQAFNQRQAQPQPLDPRLLSHADRWMTENKWYDPNRKDQDSKIVFLLDHQMGEEGWDPTTPEYWEELSARVKRYLPHRSNSGYTKPNTGKRSAPPVAGSGRESSANATSYRLSPERVQAIKQAGKWDDPAERSKMINAFRQYDKEHAA
jgi:hypothetical protein